MKTAKRLVVAIAGLIVLLLGIVMIPYPGPGWLVVFAGLGILATEFEWARRLLRYVKARYESFKQWLARQSLIVKLLTWTATLAIVLLTVWMMNGYGMLNTLFDLGWDWAVSPIPIFR